MNDKASRDLESSARTLGESLRSIVAFGNRYNGTTGERKAREYVLEEFRRHLPEVSVQDYSYLHYEPISSNLVVADENIPCKPLQYSSSGQAVGEPVYIGEGTQGEIAALDARGVKLEGKIAIARSFMPCIFTDILEERKIAGLVVLTDPPDDLIRCLAGRLFRQNMTPQKPSSHVLNFPGVTTSLKGADKLWSHALQGRTAVRVEHKASYANRRSCNVFGAISGKKLKHQKVVVGAHYDSQITGVGAYDNATGVAALLELARIFGKRQFKRSIVLTAFSGEESGLWGSSSYVENNKDDLKVNCIGMINIDGPCSVFPAQNTIWATGRMANLALRKMKEVDCQIRKPVVDASRFAFSDYYPFARVRVPVVWIFEYPPMPYYHTESDALQYVDLIKLAKASAVTRSMAFDLASRA
jgi:aminopeptidase YwaD